MIAAVYDTNVVVAGLLNPDGLPASLLDLATQRRLKLVVSPFLLSEYETVLVREKFGLSPDRIRSFLRRLRAVATVIEPTMKLSVLQDPPDNRVLECAVMGRVDYLVTGNARHFPMKGYQGVRIANPRQFWEAYKEVSPIQPL